MTMSDAVDSTLVVDVTETVEGVMAAIEQNGYRSVVVVDEHQRVVGTASDGDPAGDAVGLDGLSAGTTSFSQESTGAREFGHREAGDSASPNRKASAGSSIKQYTI